jgi:hypothetical protein
MMTIQERRGVIKLVVVSADGARVLARPNGLAGWTLPTIAATVPLTTWDAEAAAGARAILGSDVEPIRPLGDDAWLVTPTGRIGAAGNTWIGIAEAARLGADEAVVVRLGSGRCRRP